VIAKGEILLVEEKAALLQRLGKKQMVIHLQTPVRDIPMELERYNLDIGPDGSLIYYYDTRGKRTGITMLLSDLAAAGLTLRDVQTRQSSLEDIFVDLVQKDA